ncbi:PAS domain S-box-containing protein [Mucilaginibacter gracilis]|uniref:histidine kinase n=1 Tax=Mucilaginibacter gracilis TaxID=423350 RepID=A0A495ITS1_9SPHI|nr:PAS domain-containing sensor histidine kinase [Mucilaginibacter gracilis]RKR80166.1 PAS domain S-box-containing protein [Mucilaginibacter gracilis]
MNEKNAAVEPNLRGLLVADYVTIMLAYWDKNLVCRFANAGYYTCFGKTGEQMVNKMTLRQLLGPVYEQNLPYILGALAGENQSFERELKTPGGKNMVCFVNYFPDKVDGEVVGFFAHVSDVSEQKVVEEKLRVSEQAFRGAFEYAATGMALVDITGKWIKVNNCLTEMIGYTTDELLNLTFQDITHPDDLNKDLYLLDELLAGQREHYHMEKRYFHKNGHILWTILAVSLVKDRKGNPLYCISQITDISQRKAAEEKLQNVVSKLQAILEGSSQVSILSTNLDGIITSINKGSENLLGYTAQDLVGKFTPAVLHTAEEIEERSNELTLLFGKDIRGFDVFVEFVKQGRFETREWTYVRKDGTHFPVQLIVTGIKNQQGQITGYLGVGTDISKIKAVENEVKAVLDLTNDQNKRLLNFAHIVSHNLRSHSSNLKMLLDYIKTEDNEESRREIFGMLNDAASNLQETITHLNEVVAINTNLEESLKTLNLWSAVNGAIGSINALLSGANGICINNVDPDEEIKGFPAYIDSVLLNTLTNAIKYRSPARQLVIEVFAKRMGNFVVLSIQDNGLGIDLERNGDKIFGMYKTFHGNKDARGIGLFITKNQVEAMGGKMEVESQVDKGSTFKIFLNVH